MKMMRDACVWGYKGNLNYKKRYWVKGKYGLQKSIRNVPENMGNSLRESNNE